jgi:hypothetical protein
MLPGTAHRGALSALGRRGCSRLRGGCDDASVTAAAAAAAGRRSAVPTSPTTFTVQDDLTNKKLASRLETPPAAPLGYTNMLLGMQKGTGTKVIQLIPLVDAPEGGVCKP